jgi:hypothetical protein
MYVAADPAIMEYDVKKNSSLLHHLENEGTAFIRIAGKKSGASNVRRLHNHACHGTIYTLIQCSFYVL